LKFANGCSRTRHAPLLLLFALALCGAGCKRAEVSEAEKELILRAQDFAPFGSNVGDPGRYESFNKTVYFDRSYELEYEYQTPEGSGLDPLYLNVSVSFETSPSDARVTQGATKMGLTAGSYFEGIKLEEKKGFFRYGDESTYYVLLSKKGEPAGSYFVTREGSKVYSLLVAGVVFDEAEAYAALVTPKLQKFSAHGRDGQR
jgi:hypothetical protein